MKKIYQFTMAFILLVVGTGFLSQSVSTCIVFYIYSLYFLLSFIIEGELEYFVFQLQKENEKYEQSQNAIRRMIHHKDERILQNIPKPQYNEHFANMSRLDVQKRINVGSISHDEIKAWQEHYYYYGPNASFNGK